MLSFEEKLAIAESFPELERKDVSLGRINFHFDESIRDKKNVVYHLHPNGNGFVYGKYVDGYVTDGRGMVNIRDFSEEELRSIIKESIASLAYAPSDTDDAFEEEWVNQDNQRLVLMREYEMWNVYAGLNLDGTFPSYNEAKQYLEEEGFRRS
ncbi:hypothetical protein [Bacillus marinisedimentorum]|uniref:hypothetical protein n=1 Tax=Bacillus marinisedimentorum TaxID=1821260 RepID=UPI000871B956|nr:hypothetical protein [Bacillus marinisedimentorum]